MRVTYMKFEGRRTVEDFFFFSQPGHMVGYEIYRSFPKNSLESHSLLLQMGGGRVRESSEILQQLHSNLSRIFCLGASS